MSLAIPDAWSIETGVWGADLDLVTGNTDTDSGGVALKFDTTAVATSVVSEPIPVEDGLRYALTGFLKANRASVGDTITIQVEMLDADLSLITTVNMFNGLATNPGNFEYVGAYTTAFTNTRYLRVRLLKAATNFSIIFDRIVLERLAPHMHVRASQASLTADGTMRNMVFLGSLDASGNAYTATPGSGQIQVNVPGLHVLELRVRAEDFNSGDDLGIRYDLAPNISTLGDHGIWNSSQDVVANDSDSITIISSRTLALFAVPTTITMYYFANSAGSPSFVTGNFACYMMIRKLFYP